MVTHKIATRDICLIGVFAAFIAVMSQIGIPMPYGVPLTMQTFAIPFAGIVLGAKRGSFAVLVYVLLGAAGVPVFANLRGGINIVLGSTGGFILSFPVMAWLAGAGAAGKNKVWICAGLLLGAIVNYVCGMFVYAVITQSNMATAFVACILPFIPTAIIKMILAGLAGVKSRMVLERSRLV